MEPVPSYAAARADEPVTYRNGCHAGRTVTKPRPCTVRARAAASRTVLLFGDSHAAHWHAAVLSAAEGARAGACWTLTQVARAPWPTCRCAGYK